MSKRATGKAALMGFSVLALTFTSFGVASSATVSSGGFSVLSYNVDNPQIRSIAGNSLVAKPGAPGTGGEEATPGTCDAENNIADPESFVFKGGPGLAKIAIPFDDNSSEQTNWIDEVQKAGGTITVGRPRVFTDVVIYGSSSKTIETTDFALIKKSLPTPKVATIAEIEDEYGYYFTDTEGILSVIDLGMGTGGAPLMDNLELNHELGIVDEDEYVWIYSHNLEYPITVEYKDSSGKSCKTTSLTMEVYLDTSPV